jgi:hypothetical protein
MLNDECVAGARSRNAIPTIRTVRFAMNFLLSAISSVLLLVVSSVLMLINWRSWKSFRRSESLENERDYRRRQFRRRMQASGMIGVIGIALFLGDTLIVWFDDPVVTVLFWVSVVMITLWTVLLAMVDIWATRRFLDRVSEDNFMEQTKLHAELYRLKREKATQDRISGNGDG